MKICISVRSFIELQSYGKLKLFPIIKKEKSRILSVIFRHFNCQMLSEMLLNQPICFCETKTICFLTETSLLKLTFCTLPLGMQAAPSSIPMSGTFYHGDLVIKRFPLIQEEQLSVTGVRMCTSTGKLPRRLAQEHCG